MLTNRKIKIAAYLSAWTILTFTTVASAGTIEESAHDFRTSTWTTELCTVCHAAHSLPEYIVDEAPLWNHVVTTGPFTMYTSPTLDASQSPVPDGISLLCLSCHDGTIALDAYGTEPTSTTYIQDVNINAHIGTDLRNDHPISIVYDSALATTDGGLNDPITTTDVIIGITPDDKGPGSIDELLLFDTKVQCSSCHDVHNKFTVDYKLLKISIEGSELCLTCHNK